MDVPGLQREVEFYKGQCWAANTKNAYRTHRKAYLKFCQLLRLPPVPASSQQLCMYAAYLARRLKFNSVKQYMNVIRLLHVEWGLPNPLIDDFHLTATLRGIRRHLGDKVCRKVPITPQLLLHLLHKLDLSTSRDANVWAAALLMFFGLLRRSNVVVSSAGSFNPLLHLRRRDIVFTHSGVRLCIRWSKTRQFRTNEVLLQLPRIKDHPLCPTQATFHACSLSPTAPLDGPALVATASEAHRPLVAKSFVLVVQESLADVCHPKDIGGHSFRRGGACWAYANNIDVDAIRQLGDWRSNAYTSYIICDNENIKDTILKMTSNLPNR